MNKKYKENFLHAGRLAKEVRAYGKSLIQKGASYMDLISKVLHKIAELKAIPAFPPQLALNHVAAHYLPQPGEDIIFSDQVVKLDIGVCYEGAIGDCAVTVDLSGKFSSLIEAVEAALLKAESMIQVGLPVREMGRAIDETIVSHGFRPIKNLSGHGLGKYQIHMPPTIPNYDDRSTAIIKPGMTFAIEPFATNGKGMIYESGVPAIFALAASLPVKTPLARSLLAKIREFNGLPFAVHDLMGDQWSIEELKTGVDELSRIGVIRGYGPLIEEAHGMVAQAENSVLVDDKGVVSITTR